MGGLQMNEQSTFFKVPAGLLGALGALWGGVPSAISPLRPGGAAAASEGEIAALVSGGLCDAARCPVPEMVPVLDVLGSANAFVRVYLSGGADVDEFVVYRASSGATASLINRGGEFELESPAPTDVFMAITAQLIGSSALRSVEFDVELSGMETVVLAAVIDLQRKASLAAITQEKDPGAVALDVASIASACSTRTGRNQWLATVMLELAESDGVPADRVPSALAALSSRGLLGGGPAAYHLLGNALLLAQRFLIIDSALTLTGGFAGADGSVSVAGFTCLQAGVHDLLYVETAEDSAELRCESAAAVLDYVSAFLDDPTVLQALGATPAAAVATAQPAPAPAAEAPMPAAPAAQAPAPVAVAAEGPRFCPRCGTPVRPGTRFCVKCGSAFQ